MGHGFLIVRRPFMKTHTTPTVLPPPLFSLLFSVSVKLTNKKFLLWKQQVKCVIKGHCLLSFVENPSILPMFCTDADGVVGKVNVSYTAWETQDHFLRFWLQLSLIALILMQMVECVHWYELWEKIHGFFHSQPR